MNANGEIVVVAKQPGLPDRRSWRVFGYSEGSLGVLELPVPRGMRVEYVKPLIDMNGNFLIKGELRGAAYSRGKPRLRRSLYCSGSIREQRIECLNRVATLRLDKQVEPIFLANGIVTFSSRRGLRRAPIQNLTALSTSSPLKTAYVDLSTTDADGTHFVFNNDTLKNKTLMVEMAADLSSKEYQCPTIRKPGTDEDLLLTLDVYSLTPGTLLLLGAGYERVRGDLRGVPVTIEMTKVPQGTAPMEGELGRCLVRKRPS